MGQTNPFNTTIHISLNVGSGAKVFVKLSNAERVQLHISYNGMSSSQCEVEISRAVNCSVLIAFQNPRTTPVRVVMDDVEISSLQISQNVPQNSPMEVSLSGAANTQILLSQAAPASSPLTWRLAGDTESNQVEVRQNAADDNSPLDCSPECPQEEYVYDYQYADSSHGDDKSEKEEDISANEVKGVHVYDYQYADSGNVDQILPALHSLDYNQIQQDPVQDSAGYAQEEQGGDGVLVCPGGDLDTCVNVCPGEFGARLFGF